MVVPHAGHETANGKERARGEDRGTLLKRSHQKHSLFLYTLNTKAKAVLAPNVESFIADPIAGYFINNKAKLKSPPLLPKFELHVYLGGGA